MVQKHLLLTTYAGVQIPGQIGRHLHTQIYRDYPLAGSPDPGTKRNDSVMYAVLTRDIAFIFVALKYKKLKVG